MENLGKATEFAKTKVDSRTPEDKKILIKGNKVVKPKMVGTMLVSSVVNEVDYVEFVEYGTRAKTMNYHKYPP